MVEKLKLIGTIFAVLAIMDLLILTFSLMQIAAGEATGYWSPFWLVQARLILNFL